MSSPRRVRDATVAGGAAPLESGPVGQFGIRPPEVDRSINTRFRLVSDAVSHAMAPLSRDAIIIYGGP